jgi:hypothetical protein
MLGRIFKKGNKLSKFILNFLDYKCFRKGKSMVGKFNWFECILLNYNFSLFN